MMYLVKEGYTLFDIKLLIGYSLETHERRQFEIGLASEYEKRLLNDNEYREESINYLIQQMQSSV